MFIWVEQTDVGGGSRRERAGGEFHQVGRTARQEVDDEGQLEFIFSEKNFEGHWERCLQAQDTIGRVVEFLVFLVVGVGRVIGTDAVERAVAEAGDQFAAVLLGAQRRVHFEIGVVAGEQVVG